LVDLLGGILPRSSENHNVNCRIFGLFILKLLDRTGCRHYDEDINNHYHKAGWFSCNRAGFSLALRVEHVSDFRRSSGNPKQKPFAEFFHWNWLSFVNSD
jgi:hypothetical protein